jgi:hypothetical protein
MNRRLPNCIALKHGRLRNQWLLLAEFLRTKP